MHLHPPPDSILFLGHFHPLLVHLPIGMITALAAMEIAARFARFKNAAASAGLILALAAPLAVLTAACGWLLSLAGGYDEDLLAWHKWLGTGTALAAVMTGLLFWRGNVAAYRTSLFGTVILVTAAGHLGGSLTHGSNYLTEYAPAPLKKLFGLPSAAPGAGPVVAPADWRRQPVFAGVIGPIFKNKCTACHGPEKSKGGLRLDSYAAMMKGGEDGLVVSPGNDAQSPLLQRPLLPVDADDHMPPVGKPQLTAGELAVLKWWIAAGAPETNSLASLQPPPEILAALAAR